MTTPAERPFKTQLLILTLVRTAINTSFRIVYPFLPSIARGLGISLTAASGLVTLRVVAGMAAPLFGPLSDRHGRRRTMEVALLLFTLASLLLTSSDTLIAAAMAFSLYGIAKVVYDPTVHAYLGDTVPYHVRGRAIGIIELSWSGAWLLGVPASGFLMERFGWRAPWAILIVLGLLGIWLTRVGLPPAHGRVVHGSSHTPLALSLLMTWRSLLRRRRVVVVLLTSLFLVLANEIPFIVYGAWLETTFGLSLSALGLASIVVGVTEVVAELGTTVVTDRLGKRRSVVMGLLGLAASLALLPWLAGRGLVPALAGVMLMLLPFEFAIVSFMPLVSEVAPDARASLLSLNITIFSFSRMVGAITGGWLWQWENIALHAAVGAICAVVAALLLARGVVEGFTDV